MDAAVPAHRAAGRGPARGVVRAVADRGRVAPAAAGPSPAVDQSRAAQAWLRRGRGPVRTNLASATPSPNRAPARPTATAAAAGPSPRTTNPAAAAPAPDRAPSPRITSRAAAAGRPIRVPAPTADPATDRARRQTNGKSPGRRPRKTTTTRPSATKAWTIRRLAIRSL